MVTLPYNRKSFRTACYMAVLFVAAGLAVAWAWPSRTMSFEFSSMAALSAAFFATRLLSIRLPQGDEVYVTLLVGLIALAVSDLSVVLTACLTAGMAESIARYSQSSSATTGARVLDVLRGTAVLGLLAPLQPLLHSVMARDSPGDLLIAALVGVGVLYVGLEVLTVAAHQQAAGGLPLVQGVMSLQRPLLTMYLVHLAMAAVALRLYHDSGAWVMPIALVLTLILQNSFNLYLRIRRGYGETIGALAHAAELDRPHDSGHARRVADLSVAVGRHLGLSSTELERIGYAALLHDIGRMGEVRDDAVGLHSQRGAAIIGSIPFLTDVAPLLVQPQEGEEPSISTQIVRTCSKYDRLRCDLGAHAAIEALLAEEGLVGERIIGILRHVIGGQSRAGVGR